MEGGAIADAVDWGCNNSDWTCEVVLRVEDVLLLLVLLSVISGGKLVLGKEEDSRNEDSEDGDSEIGRGRRVERRSGREVCPKRDIDARRQFRPALEEIIMMNVEKRWYMM